MVNLTLDYKDLGSDGINYLQSIYIALQIIKIFKHIQNSIICGSVTD